MSTPRDPLLDAIDSRLKADDARDLVRRKESSENRLTRMAEDANAFQRFALQVGVGATWMWNVLLNPLRRAFMATFGWFFRQYRKLWSLAVYRRTEFGTLRLSKTRAGLFLTATVLAAVCAVGMASFVFDGVMYAATSRPNEIIYLTQSQEVDAEGNVHAVRGCESLPCSDLDSVYFRISPSAFNHVWSLVDSGSLFYPDYVSAAVPPGVNRCTVTSYGVRMKFLMRGADIYPEVLKASCSPVQTENDK